MEKYHFIYKTTNLVNKKFYVGMHSTKNLNDGYLGSGKLLWHSIRKYGLKCHKREILEFLPSRATLERREAEIVNEDLLANPLCMNLKVGGTGGWDHCNFSQKEIDKRCWQWVKAHSDKLKCDEEYRRKISSVMSKAVRRRIESGEKLFGDKQGLGFLGKSHTEETKQKMRKSKNRGKANSQFGTRWIYSLETKTSKRINKEDPLPDGWFEGRKVKF